MDADRVLADKFAALLPHLDEKQRRLYAAAEARALGRGGITRVARAAGLLRAADYSLQAPRKTLEGSAHPDRDAQFRYLNERTKAFQAAGLPVISVDTKKKELVGPFKNGGRGGQAPGGA